MHRQFITSLLLGSAMIVTGCATTASGVSSSAMSGSKIGTQKLQNEAPPGTILAVVRYPAFVDSQAKDKFYEAFGKTSIGGKVSTNPSNSADQVEVQGLADSVILKSNYFALSLYKELVAKLPEHSVLLSPHEITLAADGSLTSKPMTAAESLPNVLAVDFAAYTFPDAKKMMGKEPLTFGDLVTPLVSVRTDHRASVPTQGVLLASAPIMYQSAGNGRQNLKRDLSTLQSGRLSANVPELDFISFLDGDTPVKIPTSGMGKRGLKGNTAKSYPLEKIKLDKASLRSLESKEAGVVDPLQSVFSTGFANQIVALLNETDMEKAGMMRRAAAISDFDESLAALTLVGSPDLDYQARYRYAERLLEAEQKYLSVQSLRLFDGVHNGEMGAQVRDMLKAEYRVLEKRRSLARKQNAATAFAILGAVAAGGAIASQGGGDGRTTLGERIAIDALIQGAIFAGTQAFNYKGQSKAVGSNYLTSVVPALDQQVSVQVNLIDSNETITAIRFDDLKAKLQTLYSDSQRSLDTVATRCGYVDNNGGRTGTWLGVCENGLAAGTGVGVLQNADGSAVEYYGYAQNGRPEGAGYMIHHRPTGSYSLEGNFSGGQANGVMKVAKAGQANRLRMYTSGQDTGGAPASSQISSPFGAANMPSIN